MNKLSSRKREAISQWPTMMDDDRQWSNFSSIHDGAHSGVTINKSPTQPGEFLFSSPRSDGSDGYSHGLLMRFCFFPIWSKQSLFYLRMFVQPGLAGRVKKENNNVRSLVLSPLSPFEKINNTPLLFPRAFLKCNLPLPLLARSPPPFPDQSQRQAQSPPVAAEAAVSSVGGDWNRY